MHCNIKLTEETILITGGYSAQTYIQNLRDGTWASFLPLQTSRGANGCAKFIHNGVEILVVVGGSGLTSVETMQYDALGLIVGWSTTSMYKWYPLSTLLLKMCTNIVCKPMQSYQDDFVVNHVTLVPDLPTRKERAELINANGNLYLIGGRGDNIDKEILKLDCGTTLESCQWIQNGEIQVNRWGHVALNIPDSLANSMCN